MPPRRITPAVLKPRKTIGKPKRPKKTVVPENAEYLMVQASLTTVGDGVLVRPSTIPAAGSGLFANRDFAKGAPVTGYEGKLITHAEAKRLSKEDRSHVRAHQRQRTALNGKIVAGRPLSPASIQGRGGAAMTNHKKGGKANVVFDNVDSARYLAQLANWMVSSSNPHPDPQGRITYLKARRAIRKGEELFVDYGEDYWK
jgi:hypothetical protein